MNTYTCNALINIGSGIEVSILEIANMIKDVIGFEGQLVFDDTKPDGTPRKLLDTSKLQALGWKANTDLRAGLELTYKDFLTGNVRM